jgi:hypothetical protein
MSEAICGIDRRENVHVAFGHPDCGPRACASGVRRKRVATTDPICNPSAVRLRRVAQSTVDAKSEAASMSLESRVDRNSTSGEGRVRNPFGVMDVPNPGDQEVAEFAASATLLGTADDDNAEDWAYAGDYGRDDAIGGSWCSRWNGGADPTILGDAKETWKPGRAEARAAGDSVYLLFDWNRGARRGLIEARRDGAKGLVGKYINLTDPTVTRPWIGLIVSNRRIDGRWPGGRLDFRR